MSTKKHCQKKYCQKHVKKNKNCQKKHRQKKNILKKKHCQQKNKNIVKKKAWARNRCQKKKNIVKKTLGQIAATRRFSSSQSYSMPEAGGGVNTKQQKSLLKQKMTY